jgi:hypothetical protein
MSSCPEFSAEYLKSLSKRAMDEHPLVQAIQAGAIAVAREGKKKHFTFGEILENGEIIDRLSGVDLQEYVRVGSSGSFYWLEKDLEYELNDYFEELNIELVTGDEILQIRW